MGGAAAFSAISALAGVSGAITARKSAKTAKSAAAAQERELAKQSEIQAKQDKMVAERAAKADLAATERKTRLGSGRRGLLFEGDETGVTPASDVLGG